MSIIGSELLLASAAATGYQVERSLRFNSSDFSSCSRVFSSAGNRKTWTWAGWVKRSALSTNQNIFGTNSATGLYFTFQPDNTFVVQDYTGSVQNYALFTTQVFRDTSAWLHILFALDTTQATASNRIKLYINGVQVTSFSTQINPSLNYDGVVNTATTHTLGRLDAQYYFDGYLADVHFIDGQALTPSSFTETSATTGQLIPKAYTGSFGTNGFWLKFADNSNNTATTLGKDSSGNGNNWTPNNFSVTGLVDHTPAGLSYRDSSTTNRNWDQSTASSTTSAAIGPDRIYWVDLGSNKSFNRVTFSVVASGQSSDTSTNFITYFSTSSSSTGSSICGGGCTVTKASSPSGTTPGTITVTFAGFASQTGRYIGITNGSGVQGGTYTYSNFKVYDDQGASNDSLVDTPTSYGTDTGAGGEVRGNYATLNPLANGASTLSNGNLDAATSTTINHVRGTIGVTSGKWYWECTVTLGQDLLIGYVNSAAALNQYPGNNANGWSYYANNGFKYNNGGTSYGASYTTGDVVGVAFDADVGSLTFYKNGISQGVAFTGLTSGPYFPAVGNGGASNRTYTCNFGQRPFAYTAPSGFKALCDTNLPAPVVAKPSTVMDVKLYTGTGSTQTISGLGFSPDFVWLKARSAATAHLLFDQIRGATYYLSSNATDAESNSPSNTLTAFTSDGFTLGSNSSANGSSVSLAAWAWDAGSSTVTNTQGSIASQVRANASAGFSIVTYTGNGSTSQTVGHGLGVKPGLIIVKSRSNGTWNWGVYHQSLSGSTPLLTLNTTGAANNLYDAFNPANNSSTVFGIGNEVTTNQTGGTYVAYCFAPVAGYSAIGSYDGNSSADGPFVYTGFRPRFIMVKNAGAITDWVIVDTARETFNVVDDFLRPNSSAAEGTRANLAIDILSNGFKPRGLDNFLNGSNTHVYIAFAESPFAYSRAR